MVGGFFPFSFFLMSNGEGNTGQGGGVSVADERRRCGIPRWNSVLSSSMFSCIVLSRSYLCYGL